MIPSDQTKLDEVDKKHGPCGICGGSFQEHQSPNVRHVWTEEGGELISKEQMAKRQMQGRPNPIVMAGMASADSGMLARLVEVLLGQNMLSGEEALYVAGMGEKPQYNKPRFRDPLGG